MIFRPRGGRLRINPGSGVSFLDTIRRAKSFLEEQGRVSLRALKLEFGLDDEQLEALVEELVDIQQLAAREGKALAWVGPAAAEPESERRTAAVDPEPLEAERRQLTVMFCDLVGSTDLAQRLDAEELRTVMRAYQESAASVIERYDGYIAQYLGDGLLVYFGYPRAHEDDAERAVRAGREILTALVTLNDQLEPDHGIRLAARVGIHTGPVVVGEMGGGAKSERLALGDTTIIAARLQSVAEADSVIISGATLRLVPGIFATRDLETPTLKGIAEPVHAYTVLQATGVRSRLEVEPDRLTPLVGRDQEIGLLLERWEHVEEGEGQVLLVSGEAGLGKSRLMQAFRQRLADQPHGWLECRCSPYTQGSAFHPVVELMEQGLGFQEGDDSDTRLARLEAGVAAAGLSAPDVVPLLAPLLSVPLSDRYPSLQLSPELQRRKTIEALVAWIFGLATSQPAVLLVEDLHWCDVSTLELLGRLLEQSPTAKVLTLASFRPDFEAPWPTRSHVTPLAVNRLSRRQARDLVRAMTPDVPLPDPVVERVVERADGVPLFVEELTKMVLESDLVAERDGLYQLTGSAAQLAVPATLQDSLMARLDRLGEGKSVAQLAAALGREFSYELLREVSLDDETHLRAGVTQLVDAELLFQRGALPEAELTFKHALIQDTAYQSMLRSVREESHARIARVLEEQFPERARAEPEVVAKHYDEAGLTEAAIGHYERAAERAVEKWANAEAVGQLRRALELLATLPESRERDERELGLQLAIAQPLVTTLGWADPEYQAANERAHELAQRIGDAAALPRALLGLATWSYVTSDLPSAKKRTEQVLVAAKRQGDTYAHDIARTILGLTLYYQGEFSSALRHAEQSMRLEDAAEPGPLETGRLDPGFDVGRIQWLLGHPDRARASSLEALHRARARRESMGQVGGRVNWCMVHVRCGQPDQTLEGAEELIRVSEETENHLYLQVGRFHRGWALAQLGDGERGIAEMQQAMRTAGGTGGRVGIPDLLTIYADALRKVGRTEDALGALSVGFAASKQLGVHAADAELRRLRGELLLDQYEANSEKAEGLFLEALDIARGQEAKSLELLAATSLARLWQRQGRTAEARDLLQPIYDWFTEGFDTRDLKDAKALLDQLA